MLSAKFKGKVNIEMKTTGIESLTEEELEKILLIGQISHYDDLNEYDYLVDHYVLTGEIPDDYESAREFLTKNDCSLANAVV